MAILKILKFPDPRLRNKCTPVKTVTNDLIKLSKNMLETMYASEGLGLSSIQVNNFCQLLIADTRIPESPDDNNKNTRYKKPELAPYETLVPQPVILFNPKILSASGEVIFAEGCLSFPSYYADIKRSKIIEVQGLDIQGKTQKIKTDGLLAICIQHEIDHLNGKLFIDHLSPLKAERLRVQIKKYGYPDKNKPKTSS